MKTCVVDVQGVVLHGADDSIDKDVLHLLGVLRGNGVKVVLDHLDPTFAGAKAEKLAQFCDDFPSEAILTTPSAVTKRWPQADRSNVVALVADHSKQKLAQKLGLQVVKVPVGSRTTDAEKLKDALGLNEPSLKLWPDGEENVNPTKMFFDCGRKGGRIVFDAFGHWSNPVVLFLHGGGQTRHSWDMTARKVAAQGFCALCIDMKGHGESYWDTDESCAERYYTDAFAEDLDSLCQCLRRQEPILVGASLGGLAILYSDSAKTSAKAIALVDIAPRMQLSGVTRIVQWMQNTAETGFLSLQAAQEAIMEYNPSRAQSEAVKSAEANPEKKMEGLLKNLRFNESKQRYFWHWDPGFLQLDISPSQESLNTTEMKFAERAHEIKCPTVLIRGEKTDVVSEAGAQAFLDLVPTASFVDVNEAGHMVAGDQNDVFSMELLRFITQAQSRL